MYIAPKMDLWTEINPVRFENPTLSFLHEYWTTKRGDRLMPARGDIIPSQLREHLGWIMLVDVLPGFSDFRYRLIGTLIREYFLLDVTGKTVSEAFASNHPDVAKGVAAAFRKCARDKAIVRSWGDGNWFGEGLERFDSVHMPLSDDGETVSTIFHAFVFNRDEVLMARQIARVHGSKLPGAPVLNRAPI